MAHERNCVVCGKEYQYCPKCLQFNNMEKWHVNYCSEQCKNTSLIINKYAFKHIDKPEAKKLLEENGVDNKTKLIAEQQVILNEIMAQPKKPTQKRKKKIVNEIN